VAAADEPTRSEADSAGAAPAHPADPPRRTWLAAERTWLAWWRTGLGATAIAIGVGRILPGATGGSHLPLKLLGLAYGILAVAILTIGAVRQTRVAEALRRGSHEELSSPLVLWLTAGGVALALATLVLIAVAF
jgi:putative membrane protein